MKYVSTIGQIDDVQLRWVSDLRSLEPDKGLPRGCRFTNDYRRILDDGETAAVIVATPPKTHFEIAVAALKAEKDVLVEKPMTCASDEASALCECAEERSRILMVGHIFLYNAAIVELKKRIAADEFGSLCYLASRRLGPELARTDVNALWNLAPHDIAIMNHLVGTLPVSVMARGSSFLAPGVEDIVELTLRYDGGVTGAVWVSWFYPQKVRETTVVGRKRMAVFDDLADERLKLYNAGEPEPPEVPQLSGSSPLENECRQFLTCIRTREPPLTDGRNGYVNVKILEAAEVAMSSQVVQELHF